jgi:hypothetical protein
MFHILVLATSFCPTFLVNSLLAPSIAPQGVKLEPEAAAQKESEKKIHEMYKVDYQKKQPAEARAFAQRLLESGQKIVDDDAMKFALLREARDVAAKSGDLDVMAAAVDEMAKVFAVDPISLKLAAISKVSTKTPEAAVTLSQGYLIIAQQASDADKYDEALKATASAETNAKASKDMALVIICQSLQRDLNEIRKEFQKLKPDTLDRAPMGAFLCLAKGDWAKGLPFLALGTDAQLKDYAEKDVANPPDPQKQAELGDAWWTLGISEKNAIKKRHIQERAVFWYKQCAKKLAGNAKGRAEERIKIVEIQLFGDEVEIVPGILSRTRGLSIPLNSADCKFEIVFHAGRSCAKTANGTATSIYVDVADSWASVESMVEISVEYWDGPSGQINLEHHVLDSKTNVPTLAATSANLKLGNTGTWKTLIGRVSTTMFRNSMAAGAEADFRIVCRGDTMYISRISCRRAK